MLTGQEQKAYEAPQFTVSTEQSGGVPQAMGSHQFNAKQQEIDGGFLSTANNPVVCIFHLLFKGLSLFW